MVAHEAKFSGYRVEPGPVTYVVASLLIITSGTYDLCNGPTNREAVGAIV